VRVGEIEKRRGHGVRCVSGSGSDEELERKCSSRAVWTFSAGHPPRPHRPAPGTGSGGVLSRLASPVWSRRWMTPPQRGDAARRETCDDSGGAPRPLDNVDLQHVREALSAGRSPFPRDRRRADSTTAHRAGLPCRDRLTSVRISHRFRGEVASRGVDRVELPGTHVLGARDLLVERPPVRRRQLEAPGIEP